MTARNAVARALGLALLLVLAACGAGAPSAPPTPSAGPPGPASPVATPATAGPPAAPPEPSPSMPAASSAGADGPPQAMLLGLAGGAAVGDEGTFTWDGLSSDAPWVVGAAGGTAKRGAGLTVAFAPGGRQTSWQARWAKLAGSSPGTPDDGGSGDGGAIELSAPGTAGQWSLQLEARFSTGRSATWYWRIEVGP